MKKVTHFSLFLLKNIKSEKMGEGGAVGLESKKKYPPIHNTYA